MQRFSRSPIGMLVIRQQISYSIPAPEFSDKCSTPHPPGTFWDDPPSKPYLVPPDTPHNRATGRELQAMPGSWIKQRN